MLCCSQPNVLSFSSGVLREFTPSSPSIRCIKKGHFDRHRFAVYTTPRPRTPVEGPSGPSIDVSIDFTRPDGQRTRPLLVENKRLYVDEHYISVWSPVLRYGSDIIVAMYKLNRLLILCLREMRPNSKVDLTGSRYYALSDRVKVLLLERLHGAPAPEVVAVVVGTVSFHNATVFRR
ncbi:hypothetical protein ANCDUO_02101 [Ancylostoma duodenale]|uniref:Uncharacterized protein n=1 Tax=Ancylostoma duodenale TaxID=51022 RepID=A0A0C2HDE8_9BILA|nr:hypothetical protein ANCDUO_02101 [Ancylostoma duodenale]